MSVTRRRSFLAANRWTVVTIVALLVTMMLQYCVSAGAAAVSSPSWSMSAGPELKKGEPDFGEAKTAVLPGSGIIVAYKSGQMLALHAKTGERLWKFGSNLLPYFYAADNTIYTVTRSGQLVSVNSQGKLNWSAKTGPFQPGDRILLLDYLYVLRGDRIQAFGRQSGKLIWETAELKGTEVPTQLQLMNNLLLGERKLPGAAALGEVFAYDRATGKKLWTLRGHRLPVSAGQGELLAAVIPQPFPGDPINLTFTYSAIDPKTGKVGASYVFRHSLASNDAFSVKFVPTSIVNGSTLYILWGDTIEAYNLGEAALRTKPIRSIIQPKRVYPTGEIAYNQLIMEDPTTGRVSAVRLDTGEHKVWDNEKTPHYRATIIGRGLYQMYEDGTLIAFDLRSGQRIFTAATGQGGVQSLLRAGPYLIAVKQSKLNGYTLPEILR
ncbi:outer membrane protein assembly factor BamB [Paenibacillus phyllosphaerae]|uniref:Outer membrane protein assembly factor BamB n=1 Tax=Paenibacillus phyllosphaerae TaxID=274593 RepID=A0A7W5B3L0_9BACL|nr:PQQ-binding-like beta-propeller repeat protein [Paenibacillus phyllosphaerae]MBB3113296.1 outer membrane protein assembly factor BamB [Paenibacillus phyllosphaerae]